MDKSFPKSIHLHLQKGYICGSEKQIQDTALRNSTSIILQQNKRLQTSSLILWGSILQYFPSNV